MLNRSDSVYQLGGITYGIRRIGRLRHPYILYLNKMFGVYDESFDLDSDGELNAVEFDYMMDEYEKTGSDSDLEDDDSYLDDDDEDEDDFEDDDFEDDDDWDDDEDNEDDDDDWDD